MKKTPLEEEKIKLERSRETLLKLTNQLSKVTDIEVANKIREKMKRIDDYLKNSNTC